MQIMKEQKTMSLESQESKEVEKVVGELFKCCKIGGQGQGARIHVS